MAENEKSPKLGKVRKNFVRFFKDIRAELKKVIWPNREQLTNNTISVLLACLLVGAMIWIVDYGLTKLIELTLTR
jgi:preprotein translocase subunit SecE